MGRSAVQLSSIQIRWGEMRWTMRCRHAILHSISMLIRAGLLHVNSPRKTRLLINNHWTTITTSSVVAYIALWDSLQGMCEWVTAWLSFLCSLIVRKAYIALDTFRYKLHDVYEKPYIIESRLLLLSFAQVHVTEYICKQFTVLLRILD